MSSALLNNVSLALAASVPKATADDAGDGEDGLSDEIVQLLLGVLENLHEETSQVTRAIAHGAQWSCDLGEAVCAFWTRSRQADRGRSWMVRWSCTCTEA